MSESLSMQWPPADPNRFGAQFSRLGWLGFYIQLALLAVPILLTIYVLLRTNPTGIDATNYLSYGSLFVMIFTTYWFFRYTRLGQQIQDPQNCPPQSSVISALWIGLWAGCLGIFFSMLLLFGACWRLLFILLANPQTGLMVAPTLGGTPTQSISAIDAVSLMSLLIILTAELVVLGLSMWLLLRTTSPSTVKA